MCTTDNWQLLETVDLKDGEYVLMFQEYDAAPIIAWYSERNRCWFESIQYGKVVGDAYLDAEVEIFNKDRTWWKPLSDNPKEKFKDE